MSDSIYSAGKYRGSLIGLAVGDALGMPLEFKERSEFEPVTGLEAGGAFDLPIGYWTDDTSMALCLAESLLEKGGYDSYDVMNKYQAWRDKGYRSSTGACFDIGNQTSSAISQYMTEGRAIIREEEARISSAGNGSIMRLAPIAIASHAAGNSLEETMELSRISARETHFSDIAEACTAVYGAMLHNLFDAREKKAIFGIGSYPLSEHVDEVMTAVKAAQYFTVDELQPTGYCIYSLMCAVWALMNFDTFESGALAAVNLGGDADTIGAIYGQLAGAYYGHDAIPAKWRKQLHQQQDITELADRLGKITSSDIVRTRFEEDGDKYSGHFNLEAIRADITELDVDAIVNAANTQLLGGSGVCGAIFDAAGFDKMTEACRALGGCEYGDAVVTPGFELKAKYVIHTVGPVYGQHDGNEADILASCYWESLRAAEDRRVESIAFPLISTGIYGYPKAEAVKIATESIDQYFADNRHTPVRHVMLVAFTDDDMALLRESQ